MQHQPALAVVGSCKHGGWIPTDSRAVCLLSTPRHGQRPLLPTPRRKHASITRMICHSTTTPSTLHPNPGWAKADQQLAAALLYSWP